MKRSILGGAVLFLVGICVLLRILTYLTQWHPEVAPIGIVAYRVWPPQRIYLFRVEVQDADAHRLIRYDFGVKQAPDQPPGTCVAFEIPAEGNWDPSWLENPAPTVEYPEYIKELLLISGIFSDAEMGCDRVILENYEVMPADIRAISGKG